MIKAETNEARGVLHAEAERRLLAQFVSGLPGDQVRIQMPINMEHAMRISITATQMEEAKDVRKNTPSRAFGLMVGQSQVSRGRGSWGYSKRPENGPGLGPRNQQGNSGRGVNVTHEGSNAHNFGSLGKIVVYYSLHLLYNFSPCLCSLGELFQIYFHYWKNYFWLNSYFK